MAGYTRVATANIANGQVVDATYHTNEYNAIETAFGTGGHVHDGTAGNGPKLTLVTATSGTLTLAQGGLGLSSAQFSAAGMLPITSAAGAFGAYNIGQGLKLSAAQLQHDFTGSGAVSISAANITINVSAPLAVSGSSLQLNFSTAFKVSGGLLDSNINVSAPLAMSGSSLQLNYASTLKVSGGLLDLAAIDMQWVGVSAATSASTNTGYLCDTSAAAFTLTLPASPTLGTKVGFCDAAGTFSTNNLTIGRNSSTIMGSATNLTVSTQYAAAVLVYHNAANGWRLV